jgi:hypothetical protein
MQIEEPRTTEQLIAGATTARGIGGGRRRTGAGRD